METLLIESNRDTAVSLVELDDETVPSKITVDPNVKENKSTWSTIIDPLILQAGDQISLESASINIKGKTLVTVKKMLKTKKMNILLTLSDDFPFALAAILIVK